MKILGISIKIEPLVTEEMKSKEIITKPDELGFGVISTDRMLVIKYSNGKWSDPIIQKYQEIKLDPAALVLHYAQEIFEGMKAYRHTDGSIVMFRPSENIKRFNQSAERMVMPTIDPDLFMESLKKLIELEKDWVPSANECSLYVRPTYIATEPILGVRSANEYLFYIILFPSGPYFKEGFKPIKIFVSDKYIRAAPGGVGFAKTGGNYASSLLAGEEAKQMGASQVLWLDSLEKKYVEEVGAMNIFFVKDGTVYTPPLSKETILPGITRASLIQLCKDMDIPCKEEALSIDDIITGIKNGSLTECFGAGTAAVVAPVGELLYRNETYQINGFEPGPITQKLYKTLTDIQWGRTKDPHNWIVKIA